MHAAIQSDNLKGRDELGDLGVDERILLLKLILNKQYVDIQLVQNRIVWWALVNMEMNFRLS
jgi:sigma54-dependent transcription regulator